MSNYNDSLLETYLFETNSLLEKLDEILLEAESTGELTIDAINEIFRSMHTIKGSSAMMDFMPLMEIAHHVEDLFFEIREHGMGGFTSEQKNELFNLLFKCNDRLKEDVEKVERGEALTKDVEAFIHEIDSFLSKSAEAPAGETVTEAKGSFGDYDLPELKTPYLLHILFDEDCGMESLRAFIVVNTVSEAGIEFTHYPPDVETNSATSEYILNNGFFLGLSSEQDMSDSMSALQSLTNIRSYEGIVNPAYNSNPDPTPVESVPVPSVSDVVQAPVVEEKSAESPESAKPAANNADLSNQLKTINQSKQSLISVSLSKLDKLMAVVGEIVITESMVASSPELANVKLDGFLKSTRQLRKLTDDLQDIAMSLRMVSVSGVFQKMNRIVRDMSKTLNKDVHLSIIGEDTEVDKTIVDTIGDPIMHLVRNAMDHGIEKTAAERIAAGKSAQGNITLSAEHTGSEVVIKVANDGADIDTVSVLAKASKKGLLSRPEDEYTKKEILNMLMLPGFSTNAKVTEYSGRGVGLDVVKKNVESVGGTVTISNDSDEGVCFTLKIPLTLAIVGGMEISVGDQTFTIPISNIRQSFKAKSSDIVHDASGHEIISCMGHFYPVVRLHRAFGIVPESEVVDDGILIWVEAGDRSYCLFVDRLLGERQVVVKPLPSYLNSFAIKSSGISGCTILGDGNISIILDVGDLFIAAQQTL